jgi:hypothetical protein
VIYIGIDDTDIIGTVGTNQLARRIAATLPPGYTFRIAVRHQLLDDPRVPCTTRNGSASVTVDADPRRPPRDLLPAIRREMTAWYVPGSDPGLAVASGDVPTEIVEFGQRCQNELVTQRDARALAAGCGIHLEDFGGTGDGVIGALAAVGLIAGGNDGRVIHLPGWAWPDPFNGSHPVEALLQRGIDEVRDRHSGRPVAGGLVDIGKHLRPAYRMHRVVLFVERTGAEPAGPTPADWTAVKLP